MITDAEMHQHLFIHILIELRLIKSVLPKQIILWLKFRSIRIVTIFASKGQKLLSFEMENSNAAYKRIKEAYHLSTSLIRHVKPLLWLFQKIARQPKQFNFSNFDRIRCIDGPAFCINFISLCLPKFQRGSSSKPEAV